MSCCTNCKSKTLTFDSETENIICTKCAVVQPYNNYQHQAFDLNGFIGTNVKLGTSGPNHAYTYRETKVYLAQKIVADILLKLDLTTRETEVNNMIRLITDEEYGMGNWFNVLVGACVYVVMRKAGKWLPLGSVCDIVGCDSYELGRMVSRVVEHLEINLPDFDIVGLFGRVVTEMFKKFCIGKEKLVRVMKQGVFLLQCMIKWYVTTGRRPVPVVVAVIVFVCELNGIEMSFEDLASELNVVLGTCKKRYMELLKKLVDVARVGLPWGNDVTVKNIMKNAPMVIQYMEVKSTCKRGDQVMSLEEVGACLDRLVNDCLNRGDDSYCIEDCGNDRLERSSEWEIKDLEKIKVSPECLSKIYIKFVEEYSNIKKLIKRVENNKMERSGKSKLFVDTTDYWKGNSELSKKLFLDKILEADVGFNAMPPSFVNGCLKTERIKRKIQAAKMRIEKIRRPLVVENGGSEGGGVCVSNTVNSKKRKRKGKNCDTDWEDFVIETLLLHRVKEEEIEKGYYNTLLHLHVFNSGERGGSRERVHNTLLDLHVPNPEEVQLCLISFIWSHESWSIRSRVVYSYDFAALLQKSKASFIGDMADPVKLYLMHEAMNPIQSKSNLFKRVLTTRYVRWWSVPCAK